MRHTWTVPVYNDSDGGGAVHIEDSSDCKAIHYLAKPANSVKTAAATKTTPLCEGPRTNRSAQPLYCFAKGRLYCLPSKTPDVLAKAFQDNTGFRRVVQCRELSIDLSAPRCA